jgi:hypothetical protein
VWEVGWDVPFGLFSGWEWSGPLSCPDEEVWAKPKNRWSCVVVSVREKWFAWLSMVEDSGFSKTQHVCVLNVSPTFLKGSRGDTRYSCERDIHIQKPERLLNDQPRAIPLRTHQDSRHSASLDNRHIGRNAGRGGLSAGGSLDTFNA